MRRKKKRDGPSWRDKPLHGMYPRQTEEVADIENTYQWLENAGFRKSTEALIMAGHCFCRGGTPQTERLKWDFLLYLPVYDKQFYSVLV